MARRGVSWALGRQSLHTHCRTHKRRRPPWVSWPHEVGPSRSLQLCQDEIVLWRYLNPIKSHHQSIQPVFQYRKKAYQVGIGWKKHTSIKVSYCWYSQKCQIHSHCRSSRGRGWWLVTLLKVTHPAFVLFKTSSEGCLKYDTFFNLSRLDCGICTGLRLILINDKCTVSIYSSVVN